MAKSRTRAKADKAESVGRKNLIINGDFQVSQRGDYTTATAYTDSYTFDRWKRKGSSLGTIQDLGRRAKVLVSSALSDTQLMFNQVLDPADNARKVGKTFIFSATVKSNNTGCRLSVEIFNYGWNNSSLVIDGSKAKHTGGGSDELLSLTFTVPDDFDITGEIRCYVGFDSDDSVGGVDIASGGYFEVADVQLELGPVATDFEHRSYGEELALCQRYYFKSTGAIAMAGQSYAASPSADGLRVPFNFPVTMRATPTTAVSGGSDGNSGATLQIIYNSPDHAILNLKSTNADTTVWWQGGSITADADL